MGREEILRVINDGFGGSRNKNSQIKVQKEADLESALDKMCD